MPDARHDTELQTWLGLDAGEPHTNAHELVQAMRESGEALTPSEETRRAAWARVEQAMAGKSASSTKPRWPTSDTFFRFLLPGMATAAVVAAVGVTLWTYLPGDDEYTVIGFKGPQAVVAIQDFSEGTPALVAELRDMGLAFQYRHDAVEGLLILQVPTPPPQGLLLWASRWNLLPPEPGEWRLKVVPRAPSP